MKKAHTLLFSLAVLMPLFAVAKDATVIFRVDETNAKIVRYTPVIVNSEDFSPIAKAELNEADSVFVFRDFRVVGQPAVIYEIDGNYQGQTLSQTSDTTTIYIPAFYLKDPEMLKELTVTASDRRMSVEKDTYIPTASSKRISSDGTELLENIGIPTISISPLDGTVSTVTGQAVSMFIDYLPASRTDVRNIRAEDVKRVDVYDSPADPRFGGARYAINFVLVEYVFGGYSKIRGNQDLAAGYSGGEYGVNSRFTYKKMTYDVGVSAGYSHSRHGGSSETAEYRFPTQTVAVRRTVENYLADRHIVTSYFRALYKTEKTTLSNILGIQSDKTPRMHSEYRESFSSPDYVSGNSFSSSDQSDLTFSWEGNYRFSLPRGYTLVFNPSASYGTRKRFSGYISDNSTIDNYADEKMWDGNVNARLQKMFGKHSVSANVYALIVGNDIDYAGTTTASQRGRDYYSGCTVQGNLVFGNLSLQPSVTFYVNRKEIDALKETRAYVKYYVYGTHMFNAKNRLTLSSEFSQMGAPQNARLDNVLYQNQIDGIAGNPDLKKMYLSLSTLNYSFTPIPELSANAYAKYFRQGNPLSYMFVPSEFDGRDVMIRRYGNGGDWDSWTYGISANAFLFNRKLSLAVNASGQSVRSRGLIPDAGTFFNMYAVAKYTISDFYVSAIYEHKSKRLSQMGRHENPALYYLVAGWGNGDWQVRARVVNPFSKSYDYGRDIIRVADYQSDITQHGVNYHCRFNLSVTYSFSYGKKKVNVGESVSAPSGVESQMLK